MTKPKLAYSGPYTATLTGGGRNTVREELGSVRACRAWAESFGTTADRCVIRNCRGTIVGEHRRDTSGHGLRWFKATPEA